MIEGDHDSFRNEDERPSDTTLVGKTRCSIAATSRPPTPPRRDRIDPFHGLLASMSYGDPDLEGLRAALPGRVRTRPDRVGGRRGGVLRHGGRGDRDGLSLLMSCP